jgi:O-antigen/teichoic acid export membrane protein
VATEQSLLVRFTASSITLTVVTTTAAAISLRWLLPVQTGIWQTMLLAQAVLNVLRFGVLSGMNRDLPFAIGAGEQEAARRMAGIALAHSLLCALIALISLASFIPATLSWQPEWPWAISAMAIVASTNFYYGYIQSTMRSSSDFDRLGKLQIVHAVSSTAQPLLAYLWGFAGFCLHAALQALLLVALAHRIRPYRVSPLYDRPLVGKLLRTGIPLFVSGYLQMLAASIDRFTLVRFSGLEELGYYAPVLAVFGAMTVVPGVMVNFFYSRLSFQAGRGDSPDQLWRSAAFALTRSLAVMAPLTIVGWLLIPPVVEQVLPGYARSTPAMQVALFSGVGLAASTCTTLLGVLRAWQALYAYVAVLLTTKVLFTIAGTTFPDPVFGVAVGSSLAVALSAGVSVWLAYRKTHS